MVDAHESVGGASSRGKPDPNVVLPPAVKKAAERAEELSKQQTAPAPKSDVQVTNFDPNNPTPPSDGRLAQPETLVRRPGTTTVESEMPASTGETPPDYEHQFHSLKGRYEREQENSRRMARQIADMQHLMASMNSAPPAPSTPTNQGSGAQNSGVRFDSSVATPRYVTPQEVQEYGEELMDVVGRRAREVYEPIIAQLTNELNTVRQQVGGVRSSVAYDASVKMYEVLAQEVPNWEAINQSNEFGRWLDQPDPLTGQIRRNILNWSHKNNLTSSVIAAFKGFLSDQASLGPVNGGTAPGNGAGSYSGSNTPQGRTAASTPQATLSQFAAPGRAKTGQTQVPPEKPFFTTADINQFYRDKTSGKYAGREAEADSLERQLIEAGREGRIRR